MSWLYAPGLEVSLLDSVPPHEPSVTSRGKPIASRSWSRAWKRATWMWRLCGLTSPRSTAIRGVEQWISSLQDSHASHSPAQGSGEGCRTSDGCGPPSLASSTRSDPRGSSWRTRPVSSRLRFMDWPETLTNSGMIVRGTFSPQPRVEPPTSARFFLAAHAHGHGQSTCPFDDEVAKQSQPATHTKRVIVRDQPRGRGRSDRERTGTSTLRNSWWDVEPDVGRVAHGIPNRVDRVRALGNAVVPDVVTRAWLELGGRLNG